MSICSKLVGLPLCLASLASHPHTTAQHCRVTPIPSSSKRPHYGFRLPPAACPPPRRNCSSPWWYLLPWPPLLLFARCCRGCLCSFQSTTAVSAPVSVCSSPLHPFAFCPHYHPIAVSSSGLNQQEILKVCIYSECFLFAF